MEELKKKFAQLKAHRFTLPVLPANVPPQAQPGMGHPGQPQLSDQSNKSTTGTAQSPNLPQQ
jgi:hypothetical protein